MSIQDARCHHCHREVRPTLHGRSGAVVDYYRMVTGPGRIESYRDPATGAELRVLRVESIVELRTCRDCWLLPSVQALLKELRQSGEVAAS